MTGEAFSMSSVIAWTVGFALAAAIARVSTSQSGALSRVVGAQNVEIVLGALAFVAFMVANLANYVYTLGNVPLVATAFFAGFLLGEGSVRAGASIRQAPAQ
jgi:hypothetical protein